MTSYRHRLFMLGAFLLVAVACGGIILHFTLAETVPMPDLANLQSLAAVTPSSLRPVTPAPPASAARPSPLGQSTPAQPSTLPALQPTATKAPNADFSEKMTDGLNTVPEMLLRPEEFAFDALPYDAPVAEFPLVLVDQYFRDPYMARDMEMDSRLSPSEADIITRMQADISGTPRPPPVTPPPPPGPGGPPPEESNSGL
jgi:hypothetical protein